MARILVIDDNADLLQMIRLLLEERGGHEVVLSAEGQDGIEKAAADPPDLAIVDVMMPGMTGYEVCQRLRAQPSTADIPIIILTARGQDVDRQAALEAGADVYIAKPVTMADLLEQVNGLLDKKAPPRKPVSGEATAFLSLRGGVGTTTLAVNLAALLQTQRRGRVCLVDLCSSSGSAALQLGLRPDPNWSALAAMGGQIDTSTVGAQLLEHASGLHILASPFVPVVGDGLPRETLQATLNALGQNFSHLVIDLPSTLNQVTMSTLEVVDTIALVLASDPPSIQATLGTLQALKAFTDKTRLILNQVATGQQLPQEALERVLRRPLNGIVPFDPAQAQTLSQGQPLALSNPGSALPQAISALVPALLATEA
jgi:DNA-binding response OmpR family regulator